MNCVLYARVSTDRQAEQDLSIPAQLQAMREYASTRSWIVLSEYVEAGASAKTTDRPQLQRLIADLKDRSQSIDVVLVHKIDRLARNVYDHAMIRALVKQRGARLASVVENLDGSVSSQLVENIMASFAEFYSANLSEETKKGMRQKVLGGGWPHKPPRGYVSISRTDGRPGRQLVVHPREGRLVQHAFELYATGAYSVKRLARRLASETLTARSGRPLAVSYLRRLLANKFYVGQIHWGGLEVNGGHPGLVTPELFERVQHILRDRQRFNGTKGTVPGLPLRGIAICIRCRSRMTAERHGRWNYYRCGKNAYRGADCPKSLCNASKAHDALRVLLGQIRLHRPLSARILQAAQEIIAERLASAKDRRLELQQKKQELSAAEMKLADVFATGDMSPDAYRARIVDVRRSAAEIEKQLSLETADADQLLGGVKRALDLATSARDLFERANDERRARLVRTVFNVIVLSRDGIEGHSFAPPFDAFVAASNQSDRSPLPDQLASSVLSALQQSAQNSNASTP